MPTTSAHTHAAPADTCVPMVATCHPQLTGLVQQRAAPMTQPRRLVLRLPPSVQLLGLVQQRLLQRIVLLALGTRRIGAAAPALRRCSTRATDDLALVWRARSGLRCSRIWHRNRTPQV